MALPDVTGRTSPQKNSPVPFAGRATASWEKDGAGGEKSFKEWQDVSATNATKHNSAREDTFKTPSSLNKRFNTPGKLDKRWGLGDTRDLQEICEQGFAKSFKKLQGKILEEVMETLAQPLVDIRGRMAENQQVEASVGETLRQVVEQVQQLQEEVKRPQIDLSPIHSELLELQEREAERMEAYRDLVQHVETSLADNVSRMQDELHMVRQQQLQEAQKGLSEIRTEMRTSGGGANMSVDKLAEQCETHMAKMLQMQESLSADCTQTSKDIRTLQEESRRHHTGFKPALEAQLAKHVDMARGDARQFDRVITQVKTTQEVLNLDTKIVLNELTKIQQALNVDFAHVLDDIHNQIRTSTADLMEDAPPEIAEDDAAKDAAPGDAKKEEEAAGAPRVEEEPEPAEQESKVRAVRITKKRFREFWCQTDSNHSDAVCQTDAFLMQTKKPDRREKAKRKVADHIIKAEKKHKAIFADAEEMKRKMRAKYIRPAYNVVDYYHSTGYCQLVASNRCFENFTLAVILLNAIWISIDTDHNDADLLINAHPVFQVAENFFCGYFTLELLFRFGAFNGKRNCLSDMWFVFDSTLVSLMVLETWFLPICMLMAGVGSGSGINVSMLRLVRMVRLLRVSRLARLLKAIPELVVLIKGIMAATRSVSVFFLLWLLIIYVFAIVFTQLTDDTALGDQYFETVPDAMNTLLLDGILPETSALISNVVRASKWYWPIIMLFITLASITVMYMLVGVLVDVVGVIAAAEKEGMMVTSIANELRQAFANTDRNTELPITQFEFNKLLLDPEIASIISTADVDVTMLHDMSDVIYEYPEIESLGLTFEKFIEIVLNMREHNPSTVKDVKEQVRVMKKTLNTSIDDLYVYIKEEFKEITDYLNEVRTAEQEMEELETQTGTSSRFANPFRMSVANLTPIID